MNFTNSITSSVRVINPDNMTFVGGLALFTTSDAEASECQL
jgi:hypothetical protein